MEKLEAAIKSLTEPSGEPGWRGKLSINERLEVYAYSLENSKAARVAERRACINELVELRDEYETDEPRMTLDFAIAKLEEGL